MNLPGNFTATGIGSLPYRETKPALDLLFQAMPLIPHWPQMPRRGHQEHFVFQSLAPLVYMGIIRDNPGEKPVFADDQPEWSEKLTEFYTVYLEAEAGSEKGIDRFAIPEEAGEGFYTFLERVVKEGPGFARALKGQVAGPVTAGLYLADSSGRSAFYDPQLRDLIVKTTAMQARWQARELGRHGLPAVVFVDEPALAAFGTSTHVALRREDLVEAMAGVVDGIRAGGGVPGAHACCGIEWPVLFEAGYRVVSFDAYKYFTSLQIFASEVNEFLRDGGILAWGIVPTSEEAWHETRETLTGKLEEKMQELYRRDVDKERLRHQAWLTPACGTGVLEEDLAEHIYRLTAELSNTVKDL